MGNENDKKTEKLLLNALEYAKEYSQKAQNKREQQVWKEIKVPCKFNDVLSALTKNELDDIRKNLELAGLSALKKAELVGELTQLIPAKFKNVLSHFNLELYHLIKKIAKNSGVAKIPEDFSTSNAKWLMGYGIVFPGTFENQKLLVMPQELVEVFTEIDRFELQKVVHRNNEWVRLTHGLLYYYGHLKTTILMNKLTEMTNQEVKLKEFHTVMSMACDYYGQARFNSHGFSDHRVVDVEKLIDEHRTRSIIDFYPFTKNQLLKAGEPHYVEKTPEMNQLIDLFLENYNITKEEMDDIAWHTVSLINLDADTSNLIQYLQSQFDLDSFEFLQELSDRLVALHNHTRMWVLKGYTPNELSQTRRKNLIPAVQPKVVQPKAKVVDINNHKKIGRNDPCPCGSGKKYKKCCGR